MKRFLCLILTVVIIISLVAIPSYATDLGDYTFKHDLLTDPYDISYSDINTDITDINGQFVIPNYNTPDWDHATDASIYIEYEKDFVIDTDYIYFTFTSSLNINDIYMYYQDIHGLEYEVTGSIRANYMVGLGEPIFYSVVFPISLDFQSDYIEFYFEFNQSSEDNITFYIDELFYFDRTSVPINQFYLSASGTAHNRDDASYYQQPYISNVLTYMYHYIRLTSENTADLPADEQMNFISKFTNIQYGAKYFSYTFRSTGVWPNYYDVGNLTNASFRVNDQPIEFSAFVTQLGASPDFTSDGLAIYEVTIYAELPDTYINNITFNTIVNSRYPNTQNNNYKVYTFQPISASVSFDSSADEDNFISRFSASIEQKMRNVFTPIQSSINSILSYVKSYIVDDIDSIRTYCVNIYSRLGTLNNSLTTFYARFVDDFGDFCFEFISVAEVLFEKLDQYFGVPAGTAPPDASDQQQGIEDSINDMDDIADDFAGVGDEIDQLLPSTPSYEDTGLSGAADIASTRILELRAVFVVLWDNSFIIQLLTFSCLLALGGFILFGER